MVAPPSPAHVALHVGQALPPSRRTMRSAALASLLPFFLISFGHYLSLSFLLVDYWSLKERTYYYRVGGRPLWVTGEGTADVFVTSVAAIAAVSFPLLCLSTVATVSASAAVDSGRRLTVRESFSRTAGVWRETSTARLYFTILFLGYVLSLVALVVVSLVAAGDSLGLATWHFLVSLLVLLSFLYCAVLTRSVAPAGSCVPAAEEGGRGAVAVVVLEAPWSTAVALMEEWKLLGLFLFFLSLLIIHGVLMTVRGEETFYLETEWSEGSYYNVGLRAHQLSRLVAPFLLSLPWMLGTSALFAYVGVLLQVCSPS